MGEINNNRAPDWLVPFLAAQVVEHHAENGFLDKKMAGMALILAVQQDQIGDLPGDFLRLVARDLQGLLPPRRGRRKHIGEFGGVGWSQIRIMRQDFEARRAAGEKYDALLSEFAEKWNVSEATIKSWLKSGNEPNS